MLLTMPTANSTLLHHKTEAAVPALYFPFSLLLKRCIKVIYDHPLKQKVSCPVNDIFFQRFTL